MTSTITKKIDIGGNGKDPHWRYKRDMIQVRYESKNGSQTRIENLFEVAQQLNHHRKDTVTTIKIIKKIISKLKRQLSTTVLTTPKILSNSLDSVTIRGKIEVDTIERIINTFVSKFILCPKCKYPEWNHEKQSCDACGACGATSLEARDEFKTLSSVASVKGKEVTNDVNDEIGSFMKTLYLARDDASKDATFHKTIDDIICKSWDCESRRELKLLKQEFKNLL